MKILIVGAGRVGFSLCEHLMDAHDIIVVDENEQAINNINARLDVMAIHGDGKNPKLYEDLDKNINLFIAVTNSDETNLLSSLMIDEVLHVDKKIVRLENYFYNSQTINQKLHIHHAIFPTYKTLENIKNVLENPHTQSIKTIENTKITLNSFRLKNIQEPIEQSYFISLAKNDIKLCGVERDGKFFLPNRDEKLYKNDLLYLLCNLEDIQILGDFFKQDCQKIEYCIVFGANPLGREVAKMLLSKDIKVRIFEKDMNFCKLAQLEIKDEINIYHTKYGLDHHFQEDEMKNAQMVIATTSEDEYNLVKCLEAKQNKIPRVLGVNNDLEYTSLMRNVGIEIIRGAKSNAFYSILENLGDTSLVLTKWYCANAATMLSLQIYGLVGAVYIKDFTQKISNLGLFYLIRNDEIISIKEDTLLKTNDILIVCCIHENSITLKKWLEKQF